MKKTLLLLAFLYGSIQMLYSQNQEDGVVSFKLPVRNSLKYNRFLINPTFSFVREQGSTLSFYNKRQWVQFDDAPQTYLVSYSGRYRDNEGVSVGLFQQNYGVLTTFGGVANFAHNVVLQEDSNLTFGLNVGFYKSGLNRGAVISNYVDPSLETVPSNSLLTVNPGINYGIGNLDFGVSMNNLVLYNFNTSKMVADDPEKSVQAHIMHTGYIDSYGFFDRSKFSAIISSEFKKEKTVISGLMLFSVPKGIWIQGGYNTVYGVSGGLGLNLTPKISVEYNFEKGIGNLSNFGSSHEVVFAYRFSSKNYDNSGDEEEGALITPSEKKKYAYVKPKEKESTILSPIDANKLKEQQDALAKAKAEEKEKQLAAAKAKTEVIVEAPKDKEVAKTVDIVKPKETVVAQAPKAKEAPKAVEIAKPKADNAAEAQRIADAKAKADATAEAQRIADAKAKANATAEAQRIADAKAKANATAEAQRIADAKAKADATAEAQRIADAKAKANATAEAQRIADAKAKADATAEAQRIADAKAKADATAEAQRIADAKAKANANAEAQRIADAKAKADATAEAQRIADAKAKANATAESQRIADAKAKANATAEAQRIADAKAKADATAEAQRIADAKAKADATAEAQRIADAKAKADATAEAQRIADAKAKADATAEGQRIADAKAKADATAEAQRIADAKAKANATAEAQRIADAKAKANATAEAQRVADAKAKADATAEAQRIADAKAKADATAEAQRIADAKAKADATAEAQRIADAKAKADATAEAQRIADAKAKADATAEAQRIADAKAKADATAEAQRIADAKAKADADAAAKLAATTKKDDNAKAMDELARVLEQSKNRQKQLLGQLESTVNSKEKELKELKEENDLSDKGIYKDPKPFKSTADENNAIESLKQQIAEENKKQSDKIKDLDNLYKERLAKVPNSNDATNQNYKNTIDQLKTEQLKVVNSNKELITSLEKIKVDTEIEKKRRIKRAAFVSDEDKYIQDVATLKRIKETTAVSAIPLKPQDFDYGTEQSNMQILKNIRNIEGGYYLVIAVHNEVAKRDTFLTKVVASGQADVNFFYDVNSSNYYIYYDKFENFKEAQKALNTKGSKPYNGKMSIVKVE